MEFEKAMQAAAAYLTFTPRFMDPKQPQGLWFCNTVAEVSAIQINAVCLGNGCEWDNVVKTEPFLAHFPFVVIVTPNAIAREEMVKQLRPRLPAACIYVITDAGFRNCKTLDEFVSAYSGTFEVALIPDQFRQDVLHETLDEAAQVLVENINNQTSPFALLFEFDGDKKATRHVLYNCTCTRPSVSGGTTTNTKEPSTETMNLTASPLPNGNTKARTTVDTPAAQYAGWYDAVWQPLGQLVVTSAAGTTSGKTALTVAPEPASGNSYKYQTSASVALPAYGDVLSDGWIDWDGSEEITATTGQQIAVVEVNADDQAMAGGVAKVTANAGG